MTEPMGTLGPAALCLAHRVRPGCTRGLRRAVPKASSRPSGATADTRPPLVSHGWESGLCLFTRPQTVVFCLLPIGPGDTGVPLTLCSGCVLRCCMASQQRDRNHSATGQTGVTPFSTPGLAAEE